ncbi:MAG TPA: zinc ribbon domain-containing protein [Candidatus Pullichristensenella avicola]|nr:zinc ribbon domain-containing protein [Candidatus Pullichristensenella avicola]
MSIGILKINRKLLEYVENSHPAIIEPEVFDMLPAEIRRHGQSGRRRCISGRIFCDERGSVYRSNARHRHTLWRCNSHSKSLTPCKATALRAETLKEACVTALNRIIANTEEILPTCGKICANGTTRMRRIRKHTKGHATYQARCNAARQALTEINAQQSALAARRGKYLAKADAKA